MGELSFEPADFIEIDAAPVPPGGQCFFQPAPDGARLRVATFAAQEPRGTIVLLNGRCEIIEKYFEVTQDLLSRGFNVATMDWRGQGLSSRMLAVSEKGHIKSFGTYLADLKLFLKKVVHKQFSGPYFALSHSMGGTPLLQLLAEGYDGFHGAVLSSPMTRLFRTLPARHAVRLMANGAVTLGMGQKQVFGVPEYSMHFENNNLTSDETRHTMFRQLLEAAPNAAVHAPTYGWLHAAIKALDGLNAPGALAAIKIPVLIVSSGADTTVDGANSVRLGTLYDQITTTEVDGALHEVLMERDVYRDRFWQAFDAYVTERLAAGVSDPASAAANDHSAIAS
ncbi:alpha/beta fold hydrolase [Aquisalinus flavus]|uniref:Lysophospholipase n=1 Tax=Aquisalinus flavus TaxID=1526572 RepID=A0A8J2Y804_9PROT|nr:alpha/beta hydrolase [Aquisalinus flavus]MBD0426097.1 alpha/beta hydrolase [Aquisalinus flavus]UNE48318.1 alpha/beta hydrolase [Aquisalinus flavus]GGD10667.1 lysophospholipase [Aquisalinus flavus]